MVETLSKEQLDSSSYPSFSSSAETTLTGSDDWSKYYSIPRKVSTALSDECLILNQDGVVDFAYASPAHPRRWRISRKLYDTAVICTFECVTTIISNAGSSIADAVSSDTGVSRELAIFCLATVYLLGQAIGGLIFPPVTEVFGSRLIYTSSAAVYAALCLMTGLAPSLATIVTGRFFCGLLSAMPTCVATGSLENMWDSRARIWAIAMWASAGIFGMAIGPLYAIGISESRLGWKWVFTLAGIITGALAILFLATLESRPSQVLRQKTKQIEKKTSFTSLRLEESSLPTLGQFARSSLSLPVRLLLEEPIVLAASIMGATVVSLIYLFAEAIPVVYTDSFGLSRMHSAFVFLILGAGTLLFFLPRLYDIKMSNHRAKYHQIMEPEDKLFGFLLASPLLAVGLWWFGVSVPSVANNVSPAISMVPIVFVGFAAVEFDTVLSGYLTDVYASYAASANAPMCFLRAIVSGVYPLFGRQMFEGLGGSNATFILAAMATLYVGVAFTFWKYGRAIRRKSKFAQEISDKKEREGGEASDDLRGTTLH